MQYPKLCSVLLILMCAALIPVPTGPGEPTDIDPIIPIELPDTEVNETMQIAQLVPNGEISNGILNIEDMRNVGWGYSAHWGQYVHWWGEQDDIYLKIFSAPDFHTTAYEESSFDFTIVGVGTNIVLISIILRIEGTKLYCAISTEYVWSATQYYGTSYYYTDDFTVASPSWSNWGGSTSGSGSTVFDIFLGNIKWGVHMSGSSYVFTRLGFASLKFVTTAGLAHAYAGYKNGVDGYYYFVYEDASNDVKIAYFDESTVTDIETIVITLPTIWDLANQQYWKQDGTELLIDPYYMRVRTADQLAFVETPATNAPSAAAIFIWSLDQVRVEYIIWDNAIWQWHRGGSINKIQSFLPRDFKKIWPSKFDEIPGVQQWGTRLYPDLSAWTDAAPQLSVIKEQSGAKNVLQYQNDATGDSDLSFTGGAYLITEFWMERNTGYNDIVFCELAGAQAIYIRQSASTAITFFHAATSTNATIAANARVKVKLIIDCTADTYSAWVDDVNIVTDVAFFNSSVVAEINCLTLRIPVAGGHGYFDALGISTEGYLPIGAGEEYDLSQWTDTSGLNCTVTINGEVDGHTDVMQFDDQDAANIAEIQLTHEARTSGTVNLWFRISDSTKRFYPYRGYEDSNLRIIIYCDNGDLFYQDSGGSTDIGDISSDQWYKLKIVFDCSTDTFNVELDDAAAVTGADFFSNATEINGIRLRTHTDVAYQGYIDDLRFSWETYTNADIRDITANVGHMDWFASGNLLYQAALVDMQDLLDGEVVSGVYGAPDAEMSTRTQPFEDQYVPIYDSDGKLVYEGLIASYESDTVEYDLEMRHGIEQDLAKPVDFTSDANSVDEILKAVIDGYCDYMHYGRGTNGDVNTFTQAQADGTDPSGDFTNTDGGTCVTSYLAEKTFYNSYSLKNEIFTDLLQLYDPDAANSCILQWDLPTGVTVISGWFITEDVSLVSGEWNFYEGSRIGYLTMLGSALKWYDGGAFQTLKALTNDYMYHICLDFNVSADTVDIYINGVKEGSALSLENNITTDINTMYLRTYNAVSGFSNYYQNIYPKDSLSDAMNTLNSISIDTSSHSLRFNKTVLDVILWADSTIGKLTTWRPSCQVYWNEGAGANITVDDQVDAVYPDVRIKVKPLRLSKLILTGAWDPATNQRLKVTKLGSSNFGTLVEWSPETKTLAALTTLATQIINNRNFTLSLARFGVAEKGKLDEGTIILLSAQKFGIEAATYYIVETIYDFETEDCLLTATDQFWIPFGEEDSSAQENQDQYIDNINEEMVNYNPLDSEDNDGITYRGTATINGAQVLLDLVNGTSTEDNVTQVSEDWDITIPAGAKWVELAVGCRTVAATSVSTANAAFVFKNGNNVNYRRQSIRIDAPSTAGYIGWNNGRIEVDDDGKVRVLITRGAGTVEFFINIIGYGI